MAPGEGDFVVAEVVVVRVREVRDWGENADVGVVDVEVVVAFEMAEWVRKAARKFAKKGRLVGIVVVVYRMEGGLVEESCKTIGERVKNTNEIDWKFVTEVGGFCSSN